MEILMALGGFVLGSILTPLSLWLFKPDWLRKKLRLEEKEPYYIKKPFGESLNNDPVIGKIYDPSKVGWIQEPQIPLKLQQGYTFFLTPDERKCKYLAKYRDEKIMFLMNSPPRA